MMEPSSRGSGGNGASASVRKSEKQRGEQAEAVRSHKLTRKVEVSTQFFRVSQTDRCFVALDEFSVLEGTIYFLRHGFWQAGKNGGLGRHALRSDAPLVLPGAQLPVGADRSAERDWRVASLEQNGRQLTGRRAAILEIVELIQPMQQRLNDDAQ